MKSLRGGRANSGEYVAPMPSQASRVDCGMAAATYGSSNQGSTLQEQIRPSCAMIIWSEIYLWVDILLVLFKCKGMGGGEPGGGGEE